MSTTERQQQARAIWEQFCDELKEAGGQLIREDLPLDELDAAEGLRYLSRLLRTGLERNVEGADPANSKLSKYGVWMRVTERIPALPLPHQAPGPSQLGNSTTSKGVCRC